MMKCSLCLLAVVCARVGAVWRDPGGWKDFLDGRDLQQFVTVSSAQFSYVK